jgi:hypothetical protein
MINRQIRHLDTWDPFPVISGTTARNRQETCSFYEASSRPNESQFPIHNTVSSSVPMDTKHQGIILKNRKRQFIRNIAAACKDLIWYSAATCHYTGQP